MKYLMIHEEGGHDFEQTDSPTLTERRFEYATEAERDAQVAHDKEMFPGKKIYKAKMDKDGKITEKRKA